MSTTLDGNRLIGARLDSFAAAYGFLSRLFLAPADADLCARLAEPGLLDEWPLEADAATAEGLRMLGSAVGAGGAEPTAPTALARDYQALFVGPGPRLAPPDESGLRPVDRLLFDEPTLQVRATYRAFGLEAPRLNREPDDHLGLELNFLSHLCVRGLDALSQDDGPMLDSIFAAHSAFLTDHVLAWAPECLDLVAEHARTDFYRGVAALTRGALEQAKASFVA